MVCCISYYHIKVLFSRQPGADSDLNRLKLGVAETVYRSSKREALGKSYQRGYQLPEKVQKVLVTIALNMTMFFRSFHLPPNYSIFPCQEFFYVLDIGKSGFTDNIHFQYCKTRLLRHKIDRKPPPN